MDILLIIFDLDGTVIADEDEYGVAFGEVLKDLGVNIKSDYPHVGGIGVKENWDIFLNKFKIKTNKSAVELALETQRAYLNNFSQVDLKKGFKRFVKKIRQDNILTALATANDWWVVEKVIDRLNLGKYFDTITTAEEVNFNKPDPEIFLITSGKLGIEDKGCLVIEDSSAGIDAAKAAGMKAVGIYRDSQHKKSLDKADFVIADFDQLSLTKIRNL